MLSVDANGVITAKKEGEDEITVTGAWRGYDAVSLTASVAVRVFGTQAIVLDRYAAPLVWDGFAPNGGNAKSMRVTATVYDGNAPVQTNITWEAATTDTDGIVTAADGTFTASGNGEGDVYYRRKGDRKRENADERIAQSRRDGYARHARSAKRLHGICPSATLKR